MTVLRWSRPALAVFSLALLVAAAASAPTVADVIPLPERLAKERADQRVALDGIRLEDGMSLQEASLIASVWFWNYGGLCGGPFDPREQADSWTFSIAVGAAGGYAGELEIHRSTGRMLDDGEVVFESFAEFRSEIIDHFGRRYWHAWLRHLF